MRLLNLRKATNAALSSQRVPHMSLANNTFTLVSDAENKKVVTKLDEDGVAYVDVHFVDANASISKIYYKEKFSNKEEEQVAPTCFSDDGVAPSNQSQEKQCDSCAQCPHNVWGTAITDMGNKGKACRDMWKTAIVVPSFSASSLFQLRIPPASLKAFNAYVSQLGEFQIDNREGTIADVVTRVFFEPGKQGIICFNPIRQPTKEEIDYFIKVNEENLALTLISNAAGAPALPSPTPKPDMKKLEAPKQEEKVQEEEVQEEDEEAILQKQLEAARAKKAAAQQSTKSVGQPVATAKTGTMKTPLGMKTPSSSKSKMELPAGMRTAKGTGATMSAKPSAVDAEVVDLKPATKVGNGSTVEGVPDTYLPAELSNMLAGIMGK